MTPPPPLPLPALLRHEGFLRALASRLVADPATVDDAVQDAWVAALASPPREGVPARPWLANVVRNAVRTTWRRGERRRRREARVARPEAVPSTAEVLEREEARRRLVAALLRLDEPYRSTIVLRFYEGLAPRDVAARTGVPVETVRTRTRRALAHLRADLDRRGGGRRAWTAALGPLLPPPSSAAPLTLGGLLVTSVKLRAALLAFVLLVAAAGLAVLVLDLGRGAGAHPRAPTRIEDVPGATGAADGTGPELHGRPGASAGAPPPAPAPADVFRHTRGAGRLRGLVRDGRTHAPVAGARVLARLERGKTPAGMHLTSSPQEVATGETDAAGRFVLEGVPLGAWRIEVRHPVSGRAEDVGVAQEDPAWLLLYPLPEVGEDVLRVLVTDRAERPVADAAVELLCGQGAIPQTARTDGEGLAVLHDPPRLEGTVFGWITARAPTGVGRVAVRADARSRAAADRPFHVVLDAAGRVEGRLLAPPGAQLRGASVSVLAYTGGRGTWANVVAQRAVVAEDGRFQVADVPPGTYAVLVDLPSGLRADLERQPGPGPRDWLPRTVEVAAGATATVDVPLVAGGGIEGVVRGPDGAPVVGARVELHLPQGPGDYVERTKRAGVPLWRLDSAWPDGYRFPLTWRVRTTDATGRYEARGLLPGDWRVRILPGETGSMVLVDPVEVADGRVTALDHRVEAAGTLELVARAFASLGLRRRGETAFWATMVTPRDAYGALSVPGIPAGAWELLYVHSDTSVPPVVVTTFDVEPGQITYVDATDVGDRRLRLRVVDRGRGVAGVRVDAGTFGHALRTTDEEGWLTWGVTTYGRDWRMDVVLTPPDPDAVALQVSVPVLEAESVIALPTGGLLVTVRDATGAPAPGARVRLEGSWRDEDPIGLARGEHARTTDARGAARFVGLPPGTWGLDVRLAGGGARARSEPVAVGDELVETTVTATQPGTVHVRVEHEDGTPAAGVRLDVRWRAPDDEAEDWSEAVSFTENGWVTDPAGRFDVPGVPPGRVRVAAWVMDERGWQATHNAAAEAEVRPGEGTEVVLRLAPLPR